MERRAFLVGGTAALLLAGAPWIGRSGAASASRFDPSRFSVTVLGRGPDVILIPGLASGPAVWQPSVAAVPGYRYHLIHVAGFAGTPPRGNVRGPIVAGIADEIARYIADRGLRRPAIVGHSMGGIIGMMVAARRPDRAGKVMVVDILPQPARLFGDNAAGFAATLGGLNAFLPEERRRQFYASLIASFTPPGDSWRSSDPDVVVGAVQELAAMDLRPELPRISAPLTVAFAVAAPEARAVEERRFAEAYRGARRTRLVPIIGSGHMVMQDRPASFQAAMREFLSRS